MISNATPKTRQPVTTDTVRRAVKAVDHAMVTDLSQDDIARLAYEIYLRSGKLAGRCTQNWYQAESELRFQRIRDALITETATVVSSDDPYSEVLNGRNSRGDAKLMRAIAEAMPGKATHARSKAQPIAPPENAFTQATDIDPEPSP